MRVLLLGFQTLWIGLLMSFSPATIVIGQSLPAAAFSIVKLGKKVESAEKFRYNHQTMTRSYIQVINYYFMLWKMELYISRQHLRT